MSEENDPAAVKYAEDKWGRDCPAYYEEEVAACIEDYTAGREAGVRECLEVFEQLALTYQDYPENTVNCGPILRDKLSVLDDIRHEIQSLLPPAPREGE